MCSFTAAGDFIWTGFASLSRANRHEIGEYLGPKDLSFVPAQPSTRTHKLGAGGLLSFK